MDAYRRFKHPNLFLSLKRDLTMITQQVFVAKEWVKDARNEARAKAQSRSEVEKALGNLRQDQARLSEKLKEAIKAKNSTYAGLKTAEKQAEDQCQKLHVTEINLAIERQLVKDLRVELQKAKEAAQLVKEASEAEKSASYLLGVEEMQIRLAKELLGVYREYCSVS